MQNKKFVQRKTENKRNLMFSFILTNVRISHKGNHDAKKTNKKSSEGMRSFNCDLLVQTRYIK